MKIEIDYNPYTSQTMLIQDGVSLTLKQGAFAKISNYPLQSWLQKRMDWCGIREKLTDIARGRKIELVFIGRTIDFEDLYCYIGNMRNITVAHIPKYENLNEAVPLYSGMEQFLLQMKADFNPLPNNDIDAQLKHILHLLCEPILPSELLISSEEDYEKCKSNIRNAAMPIFISEKIYRQYGNEIESMISRGFSRPYDSVCILIDKPEHADFFLVQQEKGINVFSSDCDLLEAVRKKYGSPIYYGQILRRNDSLIELSILIRKESKAVDKKLDYLRKKNIEGKDFSEEVYTHLLKRNRWYKRFEEYIKKGNIINE